MKKYMFTLIVGCALGTLVSAQIYSGKTTEVSFFSTAPMENITAVNKASKTLLNTKTGVVQVKMNVIGFIFEKPLMQEHFNENYMESDKFPEAKFSGTIEEKIDYTKDGIHKLKLKGKLIIHGVEKERTLDVTLTIKNGEIQVDSKFNVVLKDHGIKVPELVFQKIAETVEVTLKSSMQPYQKK